MTALHNSLFPSKVLDRPSGGNSNTRRLRSGSTGARSSTTANSRRALPPRAVTKDWKLVQQAIAGDFQAREELFATHSARLYHTAFSVLRNKEDAEDAVQNSLCRAFINLRAFQARSSFSTWLTRIVINSALMILRKNRNVRVVSIDAVDDSDRVSLILQIPDPSPNPEQIFMERERNKTLSQAICTLRPRIRAVVEFGQLHDLSLKETARGLGISVDAAKGRLFHARGSLRKSAALRAIRKPPERPA